MSDRLEREIEEILGKIDQFPAPETRRARARKRAIRRLGSAIADRQRAFMRELSRVSISQVMLASFLMILGSFFFRRFSPLFMQWVLYAGIVLFISSFAILMFSRGSAGSSTQTRWRGREITYQPAGPSLGQRLRHWLRSRRAPR
jgi:hypothetical protein